MRKSGYLPAVRSRILYALYLVISASAMLLVVEAALFAVHYFTENQWLSPLHGPGIMPKIPNNSEEYVKIAIIGGSSAAGFSSEAHFGDILAVELDRNYPHLNFHVANLAVVGYPFHRHQAELVKAYIDKYDIFLIYAGHNEAHNYLDDTGYFRPPELKGQRGLQPLDGVRSGALAWLQSNSRVYSITQRINREYVPSRFRPSLPDYAPRKHAEIEFTKGLPPRELAKIGVNFEKDLKEIGELADEMGKTVVISSVAADPSYPPYYSVHKSGLSHKDLESFDKAYQRGLVLFDAQRFGDAISSFSDAAGVDSNVAILNYWIGRSYLEIGETDQSRKYILKSIDEDGLPIRVLSSLSRISEETAHDYGSVHFVDSAQNFYEAIDAGIETDKLFADYIHPSLAGHAILAHTFLKKLAETDPLIGHPAQRPLLDFTDSDWISSVSTYEERFAVSSTTRQRILFNNAIYNWLLARSSSNPEVFSSKALESINRWFAAAGEDSANQSTLLLFQALVAANEDDDELAIRLANQATTLSPKTVQELLYKPISAAGVPTGNWVYPLNESGLDYNRDDKKFTRLNP